MPTSRDTAANITASDITASHVTLLPAASGRGGDATLLGPAASEPEADLTIDCDRCALRNTNACDDCVVSFLLEREPDDAVVIDADEARAMRMLERAGLVPTLRFSTQAG